VSLFSEALATWSTRRVALAVVHLEAATPEDFPPPLGTAPARLAAARTEANDELYKRGAK